MKRILSVIAAVAALTCFLAVPAFSADKLVVKDAGGTNTVFVVTDTGSTGIGVASPLYVADVSAGNVSKSSLHFSLNGTDTGGWITSVSDNNFWLSSGAVWDSGAGGWVQKSPDGNAVMAGSGLAGYRIFTRSGCTVGTSCPTVTRLRIDLAGRVGIGTESATHLLQLAGGAYSDGATWVNASSRAFKENIHTLSTDSAMDVVDKLTPVTFAYKTTPDEEHVGFIAEDVPDLVAVRGRKGLDAMNIVAVLTKVVQEQKKTLEEKSRIIAGQQSALEEQQKTISKIADKLDRLEREIQTKGYTASRVGWTN